MSMTKVLQNKKLHCTKSMTAMSMFLLKSSFSLLVEGEETGIVQVEAVGSGYHDSSEVLNNGCARNPNGDMDQLQLQMSEQLLNQH